MALDAHAAALGHLHALQEHYIDLGLTLLAIENQGWWDKHDFDSFAAYCAAPIPSGGLGLKSRWRQACMQVARRFVLELGVDPQRLKDLPKSNLQLLAPVATEENVEEVLADAESLGYHDVEERRKSGAYTGTPQSMEPDPPKLLTCPDCGFTAERREFATSEPDAHPTTERGR